MISDNNSPVSSTNSTGSGFNFDIKKVISRYLKLWYWFVISVTVLGTLAYVYIRYTIPQYNVSATIMISQEQNISESGLSAFKDLGLLDDTQNKL
ncbi:hypothetical protein AB832_00035 [Flavobacteriaceae bacterium (ex Bugula neritina AB1)]|nr:hypothetical protein AB832_00035 [Flavobacteriaceae bacterium (ex Bugula neritina AB1)]